MVQVGRNVSVRISCSTRSTVARPHVEENARVKEMPIPPQIHERVLRDNAMLEFHRALYDSTFADFANVFLQSAADSSSQADFDSCAICRVGAGIRLECPCQTSSQDALPDIFGHLTVIGTESADSSIAMLNSLADRNEAVLQILLESPKEAVRETVADLGSPSFKSFQDDQALGPWGEFRSIIHSSSNDDVNGGFATGTGSSAASAIGKILQMYMRRLRTRHRSIGQSFHRFSSWP